MVEDTKTTEDVMRLDPRQQMCWDLYATPGSETFSNALQSAIRAGYDVKTANRITNAEWFKERLKRLNLLSRAEAVLQESMDIDHKVDVIGMFGPIKDPKTKKVVRKIEPNLLRIKQDTAKFLTERLGKGNYSTRQELTDKDGGRLFPTPLLAAVRKKPNVRDNDSDTEDPETEEED